MAIQRRHVKTSSMNDGFSQMLSEAVNDFKQEHISVIGDSFQEVLQEDVLFDRYKDSLLKGLNADDAANLGQMFDNTRDHILTESQLNGIQPISSMTFPMQRKAWPRIGIIHAIPTEPTDFPKFSISFMKPYMVDNEGVRHYLPEMLRQDNTVGDRRQIPISPVAVPSAGNDLLAAGGGDVRLGDGVDVDFYITSVKFEHSVDGEVDVAITAKMQTLTSVINLTVTHNGETDTVFGQLDRKTGMFQVTSVAGKVIEVNIEAYMSEEANNSADSVGFDIDYKDLDVGTGRHIAAPLSTEWLQDLKAMYQIDGALKLVDIISDFLAQKLDKEGLAHLDKAYEMNETSVFTREFDVNPPARYAGSFKDWRSEVRTVVDHLASSIKDASFHTSGSFNIVGNQLDVDLITNVDWMFTGSSEERGGVEVNYNIGALSGSNAYNILTTPNNPKGALRLVYVPSVPDYSTVKYYPYAFNVENNNGYRDPNRPNLPAIVVNRRHIFDTIHPLVGRINIVNNNGQVQ